MFLIVRAILKISPLYLANLHSSTWADSSCQPTEAAPPPRALATFGERPTKVLEGIGKFASEPETDGALIAGLGVGFGMTLSGHACLIDDGWRVQDLFDNVDQPVGVGARAKVAQLERASSRMEPSRLPR